MQEALANAYCFFTVRKAFLTALLGHTAPLDAFNAGCLKRLKNS